MFKQVAKLIGEEYYDSIRSMEFVPSSTILMNAGNDPCLASCYALVADDYNLDETLETSRRIHESNAGIGFAINSYDPLSIVNKIDSMSIKAKREPSSMAMLSIDHPAIQKFIKARTRTFMLNVAVTDDFMEAVRKKQKGGIWKLLVKQVWERGQPGLLFIDSIDEKNPVGKIAATSCCGEIPLCASEACFLGSINLPRMVVNGRIDWKRLEHTTRLGVRFLDSAIDISDYPTREIQRVTRSNRRIGLGVMGLADMLKKLGIPYTSTKTAAAIMDFINTRAHEESERLGKKKGEFPNYYKSKLKRKRRNATVTSLQPTGRTSRLAGVSSGIEPTNIISAKNHVLMQAGLQQHVDSAISKTINLRSSATPEAISKSFILAHEKGCKGITAYRA